jgi:hypothetical protein
LAQADPQTMAPLTEGYRYHVVPSSYGGVAQRWVLIYSEPRQPQAQRTVDKQWLKQSANEVKAFQTLCRTAFACEADAHQALAHFAHALQTTFLLTVPSAPAQCWGSAPALEPARPDVLSYRKASLRSRTARRVLTSRLLSPRDERINGASCPLRLCSMDKGGAQADRGFAS